MALPYPEGEVFFKRSVLKNNGNGLNPDNLTSFNSHALIEWCWNETPGGGGYSRNRVKHRIGKHNKNEEFGFYDSMIVMFGTKEGFEKKVGRADSDTRHDSRHSGIERMVKTQLPEDTDEYEKRKKGGPLMTAVTPIKLDNDLPYMYIDLIFPIRAIYFPLAQKPSSVFPDLCSYLMVDFRLRQGVKMFDVPRSADTPSIEETLEFWKFLFDCNSKDELHDMRLNSRQKTMLMAFNIPYEMLTMDQVKEFVRFKVKEHYHRSEIPMDFDLYAGLGVHADSMLSIYIPDVYNYLILPRQMRSVERGLYMPTDASKSIIRVHSKHAINTGSNFINPSISKQNLSLKLDMTKILEGHLGVQVVWQPFDIPEPEDANQMMVDLVEAGLCFIPVIGPLASNCFGLFIDIVNNPDAFKEANPLEMSGDLLDNAASAAEAIADGLPKYSKAGKIAGFLGKIGGALTKMSKPN
ncbi:hypothetical protein Q7P37_001279 [Cladosporium fusiforme]